LSKTYTQMYSTMH